MYFLKESKVSLIISALTFIVLGLVLCIWPQTAMNFICIVAGAALLIGGASVKKASIVNVVVGTFLFQGILTMTPSVINSMLQTDMSEVIRIIVSNGMILYALTRVTKVRS